MSTRLLFPCVLSMFLSACATEVLGEPELDTEQSVAASSEELNTSAAKNGFYSFFLPASREALCVFADASTYRGAATTKEAAYTACANRAVSGAPGEFRIGVGQTRAANGTCTTAVYVDGVARNQRTSACNASASARLAGGSVQVVSFGPQPGLSTWWAPCAVWAIQTGTGDYSGGASSAISCLTALVNR